MSSKPLTFLLCAILFLACGALYGAFLWNPIIFDDQYLFDGNTARDFGYSFSPLTPRWFPYATMGWTDRFFGLELINFRLGNLFLHSVTVITLFLFLKKLFQTVLPEPADNKLSLTLTAFFAALLFALHPVASYAPGYLIQRTIVMATLFGLLTLFFFLKGLQEESSQKKKVWFFISILFYFAAVFSKEHSIPIPGIALAMTFLIRKPSRALVKELWLPFSLFFAIALLITLRVKGVIGSPYEPLAVNMLQQLNIQNAYPLSILTQGTLFFKYLQLWLLPSPAWMSIDMREPFATQLIMWPYSALFVSFLIYPLVCFWLLLKGGRKGLAGFALLSPWILFIPELSTVRIQEPFVLYRSYLWMPLLFAAIPFVIDKLLRKQALLILMLASILFVPLTWNRLTTLSHSFYLWNDAEILIHNKENVIGAERIYYNRANAYSYLEKYDEAQNDYSKVIAINPQFSHAYLGRANAYFQQKNYLMALDDFNKTITLAFNTPKAHMGRGLILQAHGKQEMANKAFKISCAQGHINACKKL